MKRIFLLLLPIIAIAAAGTNPSERKSKEERLGEIWQESVSKESSGQSTEALQLASSYLKEGGDAYLATMRAAWIHYKGKNYDEASKYYVNATRIQPGALSPRIGLFNIANDKSDVAAAAKAGELVLAVEPTHYRALMAVAWGAYQSKSYGKAGSAYRKVMSLYPEDMDALSGASWSAFYQGQKNEAKQGFRRLVSMNPSYPYAKQGIAACK